MSYERALRDAIKGEPAAISEVVRQAERHGLPSSEQDYHDLLSVAFIGWSARVARLMVPHAIRREDAESVEALIIIQAIGGDDVAIWVVVNAWYLGEDIQLFVDQDVALEYVRGQLSLAFSGDEFFEQREERLRESLTKEDIHDALEVYNQGVIDDRNENSGPWQDNPLISIGPRPLRIKATP